MHFLVVFAWCGELACILNTWMRGISVAGKQFACTSPQTASAVGVMRCIVGLGVSEDAQFCVDGRSLLRAGCRLVDGHIGLVYPKVLAHICCCNT